jgi:thiol-disulfide isomerase/thioredoxin
MISSRSINLSMSTLALMGSATLFFAVTSCSSSVVPSAARAEDGTAEETDPDFIVPDGTPQEINEFVEKLKKKKPKFANRQEFIDHTVRAQRAISTAADKILKQETTDKVAASAAQMKLAALTMLASGSIEDYPQQALAAVTKLKGDSRPAVVKVANEFWNDIRVFNAPTMTPEARKELADELVKAVTESKFSRESLGSAMRLGDVLASQQKIDEAGDVYDRLALAASESSDAKYRKNAELFEAMGRRIRLPGKFMLLKGKTLTGGELDWASYRGKVVLVDFWATWCGPCVAELPNVKECYEKYHEKGFDVVGISLDQGRDVLEKFVQKEKLPWTQLFDDDVQKGEGWSHPMVRYYGIDAIPAAILLDKEGKVVSMAARGEDLPKLVEKLLGKAE